MKHRIILLFLLSLFINSCFEEKLPRGFFAGTEWNALESGGIYSDENILTASFIDTHTLILNETTFTHTIHRFEGNIGNGAYLDKGESKMEGLYTIKYPDITFIYPDGEKKGLIAVTTLQLYTDPRGHILEFLKKATPGK
jgi:hypothetical protein